MYFSNRGPVAVALLAGLACASPVDISRREPDRPLLAADASADGKGVTASVDLDVELQEELLVAGVLADVAVAPVIGAGAAAEVSILCKNCFVKGSVDASVSLEKVVPALSLSLNDIEAYLDLDIQIGAAATIAVNLFTPEDLIKLSLPGLDVEAAVFLDLVLDVDTAIDLSAGLYVELVDEAHIDTDILSGKILDAAFSGLSVATLPVTVRIGCTELRADLRLRVQLAVGLDVDAEQILPILDTLPDIGAGLEVAVWANLLEYVGLFCDTPACPLSKESYGLNIGADVGLNVEVEDVATLHLAPTISTTVLAAPTSSICEHGPRPSGTRSVVIPTVTPTGQPNDPTASVPSNTGDIPSVTGSYPVKTPSTLSTGPITTGAPTPTGGLVTSTVTVPKTYTVTTCAAHVPNCPAGLQREETVIHTVIYTTFCPVTATITDLPRPTQSSGQTVSKPQPTVTLTPTSCVATFTPPANAPSPRAYAVTSSPAEYPTGGAPPSTTGYPVVNESISSATQSVPPETSVYETGSTAAPPISTQRYPTEGLPSSEMPPYPTSAPSTTSYGKGTTVEYPTTLPHTGEEPHPTSSHAIPTGGYPVSSAPPQPPVATAGAGRNAATGMMGAAALAFAALL